MKKEVTKTLEVPKESPMLVTAGVIMKDLQIGRTKLYNLMHDPYDPLPSVDLGHSTLRFDRKDVAAWLERFKIRRAKGNGNGIREIGRRKTR